jgi:hypothetical protein
MKYDVASHKRWNPQPSWQSIEHHPPPRHEFVTVRRFHDGTPFKAKHSGEFWRDEAGLIVNDQGLQWLMPG